MLVPLMLCLSLAPADVYSFGVVLWELATGQEPWAEASPMQVDIATLCILESAMPWDAIAMHAQGRYGKLLHQLILDSALVKATLQEITI